MDDIINLNLICRIVTKKLSSLSKQFTEKNSLKNINKVVTILQSHKKKSNMNASAQER
jgi:hypothetical protein